MLIKRGRVSSYLWVAALQEAGIDLVEQPTPAKDFASLVRLSKKFNIGILADESIADSTDTLLLAQQGFTGSVALKIGKAGGLFGALDVAAVCNAAGIGLYGGTLLEGTVGTTPRYMHGRPYLLLNLAQRCSAHCCSA